MMQGYFLFAYIGPETILPVTSVLAAVCGVLLAFGGTLTRPVVSGACWLLGRKKDLTSATPTPINELRNEPGITA